MMFKSKKNYKFIGIMEVYEWMNIPLILTLKQWLKKKTGNATFSLKKSTYLANFNILTE